ncbi:contractile injection system protein, VgrG/Pvc8 family [Meridianimarinicoccus sp. RP-17]|uniref:contractile injection system protein, VgrG/Pvc8 family n=1 Tax=Meridianimarinicoccus zhengii TaxID=2056810 RepID=UPI0013A6B904|nr:contractile injection system protein, VgrG/Pvc8 family [Phycocomes zhengii]
MKPVFRIVAEGEDVTAPVGDRLLELRILDAAGIEADTLSLTLDDRDGRLIVPPHQSLVRVWLGMSGPGAGAVPLTPMGAFRVDDTELTGPTRQMRIRATAADMSSAIRAPRTRAWEGVTLGDMLRTIAGEAGLQPEADARLAAYAPGYVAQTAESDLNLLTRIARRVGGIVKPADGRLVLARRGAGTAADGTPLSPVTFPMGAASSWSWRTADRGRYGSVAASWTELGSAAVNTVIVGDGQPRRVLRHVHATEAEAARAAQAALDDARRGAETAQITLARFQPAAFAGARVRFAELRPEWAGDWTVNRAHHVLTDRLVTELDLERPPAPD